MMQDGHELAERFCKELELMNILYYYHIRHQEVLGCLESKKIYERYAYLFSLQPIICRHLVVRERKGEKRIFLLVVDESKGNVDLHLLKEQLHVQKLEFVDDECLSETLHTYSGNVSVFHLIYDTTNQVHMILDAHLIQEKQVLAFHPLYNGDSVFLKYSEIKKFLEVIHHDYQVEDIPRKSLSKNNS